MEINTNQKTINSVKYLCEQIVCGVTDADKDQIRSHLEDLNLFLAENRLVAE